MIESTLPKDALLRDWLPFDYVNATISGNINKHLDDVVTVAHDGREKRWPGKHKNVLNWCELATGFIVGWNESPSIGWAFIIKRKAS
jgi:hypothetical protein